MKKILCALVMLAGIVGLTSTMVMEPVSAANGQGVNTNILSECGKEAGDPNGGGIWCILNIILTIMTFGVVTLATLGLIISGAQYISAADSPERMAKAKNRIINVLIGLAAYAVLWAALNWLLPGGLFH